MSTRTITLKLVAHPRQPDARAGLYACQGCVFDLGEHLCGLDRLPPDTALDCSAERVIYTLEAVA